MQNIKTFAVGDILVMKKNHASGTDAKKLEVLRVGSDVRVKCVACGHETVVPRVKLERNIRNIISANAGSQS